jgi:hypothetical protein
MTSLDQVRPLLARFSLAFGQPFGLNAASADELARTWHLVVSDCHVQDLSSAVDQWIRTQKKWPAPATIREDAWALTRSRIVVAKAADGAFCQRCFARDLIETAAGRFMPMHADNCPGLHESDYNLLQHARVTNRTIWKDGAEPVLQLPPPAA